MLIEEPSSTALSLVNCSEKGTTGTGATTEYENASNGISTDTAGKVRQIKKEKSSVLHVVKSFAECVSKSSGHCFHLTELMWQES